MSTPETFGRLPTDKDQLIHTSEATPQDLSAISAPISKGEPTESRSETRPLRDINKTGADTSGPGRAERTSASRPVAKASTGQASPSKPKLVKSEKPSKADAGAESSSVSADENVTKISRKGGRRGIRLKDKLPGKKDLGIG